MMLNYFGMLNFYIFSQTKKQHVLNITLLKTFTFFQDICIITSVFAQCLTTHVMWCKSIMCFSRFLYMWILVDISSSFVQISFISRPSKHIQSAHTCVVCLLLFSFIVQTRFILLKLQMSKSRKGNDYESLKIAALFSKFAYENVE